MRANELKPGMYVKHSGMIWRLKTVWESGPFTHADVFGGGRISFLSTDVVEVSK